MRLQFAAKQFAARAALARADARAQLSPGDWYLYSVDDHADLGMFGECVVAG